MKCEKKAVYRTKRLAKEVAARRLQTDRIVLVPYECSRCSQWHLSHQLTKHDDTVVFNLDAEEIVRTWKKVGLEMIKTCVKRGAISQTPLNQAIKLIRDDPKIPDLWKLAELVELEKLKKEARYDGNQHRSKVC